MLGCDCVLMGNSVAAVHGWINYSFNCSIYIGFGTKRKIKIDNVRHPYLYVLYVGISTYIDGKCNVGPVDAYAAATLTQHDT